MVLLTLRQTDELHSAILQYFQGLAEGLEACAALVPQLQAALGAPSAEIMPHLLEKKWLTVLRLQKRILELEAQARSYKQLLEQAERRTGEGIVLDKWNWVPSALTKMFPTELEQLVNSVVVHPKLPLVAAGCSDGTLYLWNLAADMPHKVVPAHTRAVHRLAWLHHEVPLGDKKHHLLATCSSDMAIKVWLGDAYRHVRTLVGHEHTVLALCFGHDNLLYLASRDRTVRVWDVDKGVCVRTFVGHSDWVRDVDVAEKYLLTCSNDQLVRLSLLTGTGVALLVGHTHVVEAVRFLPKESHQYLDGPARARLLPVDDAAYADAGVKYCVSAGRDNLIKLWLLPPPSRAGPLAHNGARGWHLADLVGHALWVRALTVHPNGRFLFSGADDKCIMAWDWASWAQGKVEGTRLTGHEGFVNLVHMARSDPDPEAVRCVFVSGGSDSTVRLWS